MVLSMAACGETEEAPADQTNAEQQNTEQQTVVEEAGFEYDSTASITFDDGNYGFLVSDTTANPAAKEATFSVVDRNGEKAVKVESTASNKMFVGIGVDGLLGDSLADVASVEFVLETESSEFVATSGNIYATVGEDATVVKTPWSIYLEKANPRKVTATFDGALSAGAPLVVSLEVNSGQSFDSSIPTAFYIYSISFKDASGNVIAADTSYVYEAVSDEVDRSNLFSCSSYVNFEGFACSGDAWAQNGFEMTEDVLNALQPGTVLEIEYSSESGELWVVMPWATAGWMRVGQNDDYLNDSHTIAQVTYEQIAALCGEDKSTWGAMVQCESDSAWEVYSMKVGTVGAAKTFTADYTIEGFAVTGDAWAQNGVEVGDDFYNALQPGTVIELQYTSETGNLWVVMPWATAGWIRVGQAGSGNDAVCDGSKCYVTYEQIEALCGEDKSTWGGMIQAESDGAWEVYSAAVGKLTDAVSLQYTKAYDVEGFAVTGDAWAQNGVEVGEDFYNALQPGTVIELQYTSETGNLWVVMPWATAGWIRVGQAGSGNDAVCDGSKCYVTYEQIEALCGEDKSTWGGMIQAESDGAWEVYAVSIGTLSEAPSAPALRGLKNIEGFAVTGDAWAQNGIELSEDLIAALVPGSVIKFNYTSETGNLWAVMPWATAGWMRVGQTGTADPAICTGSVCYVTYEQIAALCGDDVSTWGTMLQAESDSAWEVYSAAIGKQ